VRGAARTAVKRAGTAVTRGRKTVNRAATRLTRYPAPAARLLPRKSRSRKDLARGLQVGCLVSFREPVKRLPHEAPRVATLVSVPIEHTDARGNLQFPGLRRAGRVEDERGGAQGQRRRVRAAPFGVRSRREAYRSVSPPRSSNRT